MRVRRRRHRFPDEAGQSLLEFALILPLALAVILGLAGIASVARARYQVALVAHGVMREAAGGTVNPVTLNASARVYARAAGLSPRASLVVGVGPTAAGMQAPSAGGILGSLARAAAPGTAVTVRALVPVSMPLFRFLPGAGWLPVVCTSTCLVGTWKGPTAWIKGQLGIRGAGGTRG